MFCMQRFSSALVLALMFAYSASTLAISTFSRQTGLPCASCHFQNFPALNSLGRSFKSNGYALAVLINPDAAKAIPLSEAINAGVVMKTRFQQSNGPSIAGSHSSNDGEFQFPDELLMNTFARINNNIGVSIELDLKNSDALLSGLKIPFIYNLAGTKVGAIAFSTSSQGAAYGFELFNTGAVRFNRVAEDRSAISAQQYIGTATKAEGIAAIAANNGYFVNVSRWSPRAVNDESAAPSANYLRLAMTPKMGNWDLGLGVQAWSGHATEASQLNTVATRAWAIDAQAQGAVANLPLGIYFSHAIAKGSINSSNLFNSNPQDKQATAIVGQLGFQPGKSTVLVSYRDGDNGNTVNSNDNAWMIGFTHLLVQNMQLQLNHTEYFGSAYNGTPTNGDRMTTLMLYSAF